MYINIDKSIYIYIKGMPTLFHSIQSDPSILSSLPVYIYIYMYINIDKNIYIYIKGMPTLFHSIQSNPSIISSLPVYIYIYIYVYKHR
jgi:hypothetical protein